mmetsp:Transcript_8975/g.17342  ORF Transcript_8975/g.17342 Transcript_8975/m.17342 type:complete len:183 (+) Transcript_8975:488-1036(+)
MSELTCNVSSCTSRLSHSAYLANCMHAFCSQHAQQWFSSSQLCPICHASVKICKKQFGPGEMLGLPPNKVLESAAIALKFWSVQRDLEVVKLRESASARESSFKEKMKQAEDYVSKLQKAFIDMKNRCKELTSQHNALKSQISSRPRHDTFSPAVFEPPSNHKMRSFGEFASPMFFTPGHFA